MRLKTLVRIVAAACLSLAMTMISSTPANAGCGDFGVLRVVGGGAIGLGSTLVVSGIGGAVAAAQNDDVDGGAVFGAGVGAGVGVGLGVALTTTAILAVDCPSSSLTIPAVASVLASTLAMILFVELREPPAPIAADNGVSAKPRPRVRGLSLRMGF